MLLKFEEVTYSDLSASALSEYSQYELMEFGHFLRSKLIEQWYDLGSEYTAVPEDLARKTIYAENIITVSWAQLFTFHSYFHSHFFTGS